MSVWICAGITRTAVHSGHTRLRSDALFDGGWNRALGGTVILLITVDDAEGGVRGGVGRLLSES